MGLCVTTLLSIPTLQLHFVFPSQPPVLISWQTSPRTENSRSLSNLFALENTALISLSIFLASIGHGLFGYLTICDICLHPLPTKIRTEHLIVDNSVLLEPRGGQIVCFIFDYGNGLYIVWRLDFMPSCVSLGTGVQGACILSLWT